MHSRKRGRQDEIGRASGGPWGRFAPQMSLESRDDPRRLADQIRRPLVLRELSGAQDRNRTSDTVIFSHVLYQLSYLGTEALTSPKDGSFTRGRAPSQGVARRLRHLRGRSRVSGGRCLLPLLPRLSWERPSLALPSEAALEPAGSGPHARTALAEIGGAGLAFGILWWRRLLRFRAAGRPVGRAVHAAHAVDTLLARPALRLRLSRPSALASLSQPRPEAQARQELQELALLVRLEQLAALQDVRRHRLFEGREGVSGLLEQAVDARLVGDRRAQRTAQLALGLRLVGAQPQGVGEKAPLEGDELLALIAFQAELVGQADDPLRHLFVLTAGLRTLPFLGQSLCLLVTALLRSLAGPPVPDQGGDD